MIVTTTLALIKMRTQMWLRPVRLCMFTISLWYLGRDLIPHNSKLLPWYQRQLIWEGLRKGGQNKHSNNLRCPPTLTTICCLFPGEDSGKDKDGLDSGETSQGSSGVVSQAAGPVVIRSSSKVILKSHQKSTNIWAGLWLTMKLAWHRGSLISPTKRW